MNYRYVVAGISILNDIEYADGSARRNIPGGCLPYAVSGIACYTSDVIPVTAGGPDFRDIYGAWFEENELSPDGFHETMPSTHHTVLRYQPDGRWNEDSLYGWNYFSEQKAACMSKASEILPFLGPGTRGLYLDALADDGIFGEIGLLREKAPDLTIMWEPPTQSSTDPAFREQVLDHIRKADLYSMNLNEAGAFFGTRDREEILRSIRALGKPCFLREGEEGASWCDATGVYHLPAYDLSTGVDPTGCGNCSTAACLWAVCEGKKGAEITAFANAAAQHCAAHLGPMPCRRIRETGSAVRIAEALLQRKEN